VILEGCNEGVAEWNFLDVGFAACENNGECGRRFESQWERTAFTMIVPLSRGTNTQMCDQSPPRRM